MEIRIVRASQPGYWYRARIGEIFRVVQVVGGIGKVEVQISAQKTGYVDVVDCEGVTDVRVESPIVSDIEANR